MSAGIALSAIFISLADGFNQEIVGLLFGSISAVTLSDLITIIVIVIIVLVFILSFTELFILSFDEEYSKVIGIPKWIQFIFIIIVAMVISASMCSRYLISECINHVTCCDFNATHKGLNS